MNSYLTKKFPWLFKYANPNKFYILAESIGKYFLILSLITGLVGLYIGFFIAPTDAQQGEGYRIIFLHVPASWMSMLIYMVMAFWSFIGLLFNTRLSHMMTSALAPTGAIFTFTSLVTGAFWGKPMWGTWWVWDARLTSELILLFLYIGYIALQSAIVDKRKADRAGAILAILGSINVPIIYFSVKWWNTLHQGSTITMTKAPSMANTMLAAMLIMMVSSWSYSIYCALIRVRCIILERESNIDEE